MNWKMFEKFYSENISTNQIEMTHEYKLFLKHYKEFIQCYEIKDKTPNKKDDYVQLAYLFSMVWSDFSLSSLGENEARDNAIFGVLSTTISNDILAIITLALEGLDYQAMNILRNLYEITLLTLNICLDENKRKEFFNSAEKENSYEVWRKHFNVKSMLDTLDGYSVGNELTDFWTDKYKSYYSRLSSFVHNDLADIYVFSYTKPENSEEIHMLNACGHFVTRCKSILDETTEIMWIITRIFNSLINNRSYKWIGEVLGEPTNDYLRSAKNGCHFVDYYYLKLHSFDLKGCMA